MFLENESFVVTNENVIDEAEADTSINNIVLSSQKNEINNVKSLNFGKLYVYIICYVNKVIITFITMKSQQTIIMNKFII